MLKKFFGKGIMLNLMGKKREVVEAGVGGSVERAATDSCGKVVVITVWLVIGDG